MLLYLEEKKRTFISKPEGLIHSNANIENVAACMATTPTNIHDAVSNGSKITYNHYITS